MLYIANKKVDNGITKMTEKTKVNEILEKSGHGFHSRVVKLLRDQKWPVLVSPYYSDNFTDKPREIDVIAERRYEVNETFGSWLGNVNIRLFIECKYISGDTVFWFDNKDEIRARERVIKDIDLSDERNLVAQGYHHLDAIPVAKLFTSEKGREDNEWISKAINQNLNALVYYRNRSGLFPDNPRMRSQLLRRVSYPIIVVNSLDHFYRMDMNNPDMTPEKISEPFQLEVNYAYVDDKGASQNEYFLIDIVSIDVLPDFLSKLESRDIGSLIEKLRWDTRMNTDRRQNFRDDLTM